MMAYSYDRRVAHKLDLTQVGLDGLTKGQPVTLYHGTTRSFTSFDFQKARKDLVESFYGVGIFLTPSKRVAMKYAHANRNIGFDPEIINDLKRRNPRAGSFMQSLFAHGKDAWGLLAKELQENDPEIPSPYRAMQDYLKVDPNVLDDICGYVIGSKVIPLGSDDPTLGIFSTRSGAPDHVYDSLDEVGLDSNVYRPKVYICTVTVSNPLVTANKSAAKAARHKGYDSVIFYGSSLVDGVPEVAVFDARNVQISHVDVL
jgi:hypothetical protein